MCREGKKGLACTDAQRATTANGSQRAQSSSLVLATLVCGLVALLFHWMMMPWISPKMVFFVEAQVHSLLLMMLK
jgi:hypothetical protein